MKKRRTGLFKKKQPIKKKEKQYYHHLTVPGKKPRETKRDIHAYSDLKESRSAVNRLKEIVLLEKFLKEKAGNPHTQEEEKIEIDHQLKFLALEKEGLKKTVKNAEY